MILEFRQEYSNLDDITLSLGYEKQSPCYPAPTNAMPCTRTDDARVFALSYPSECEENPPLDNPAEHGKAAEHVECNLNNSLNRLHVEEYKNPEVLGVHNDIVLPESNPGKLGRHQNAEILSVRTANKHWIQACCAGTENECRKQSAGTGIDKSKRQKLR
eukprot:764819-Hanusia_phi.AAC.2